MSAAPDLAAASSKALPISEAASPPSGVGKVREEAWYMPCGDDHMLGILSDPGPGSFQAAPGERRLGALIVVGGPQYRAGSHRQFVQWARALATGGVPTLRFDVRGMGDSSGAQRAFTGLSADIAAAIDALLARRPELDGIVLCGLCDGASAAMLYLHERRDPRVAGLVLLNPWVRSDQTLARTMVRHYYLQRLLDRGFWAKLLRGQVAARAVRELWGHLRQARGASASADDGSGGSGADTRRPYQDRMALALRQQPSPVLLVLSGDDYTAKEFNQYVQSSALWQSVLGQSNVQQLDLPSADHTFSGSHDRDRLHAASVSWIETLTAQAPGSRTGR